MPQKVLLIYPPESPLINREDRCQVPTKNVVIAPPLPPTDLMYLAGMAEAGGCECRIRDYTLKNSTQGQFTTDLNEFKPDYLLLSITTPTIYADLEICSFAKKLLPKLKIIAKGAHFLKFNREVLEAFPELDIIIRGEAEVTFQEIVSGKDLAGIKGITWRGPNGILNNPDRPFIENLDTLPFPSRHLVDNKLYTRPDNGKPQAVIKTSRGCPYNCFFCLASPVYGSRARFRSPENILKEIKLCMEQYKIRDFLLWSDIFTLDKKWVMDLCNLVIESRLGFNWAANTRTDTIDIDIAMLMKKSGCSLVSVGVESGNQEILDKIGKGVKIEGIKNAFGIFKKAGLLTFAYYIIGLPWETEDTVKDTIKLSIELDSDFANFFVAAPFPGTRFFDYAVENNLFEANGKDVYKTVYYSPVVKGHHLSKKDIDRLYREAIRRFYLRPGYILKSIRRIHSLKELYNYTKAAMFCVI